MGVAPHWLAALANVGQTRRLQIRILKPDLEVHVVLSLKRSDERRFDRANVRDPASESIYLWVL